MRIYDRFLEKARSNFFLFGPRGTGKSTWVKFNYKDSLLIDLLAPDEFRRFNAKPERLKEIILGNPGKKTIIIDEIQRAPALLSLVHSLIESKPGLQFILTGSSSRRIKSKGVDLLAGRALMRFLHAFMASELKRNFSLEKALQTGLIPLVVSSQSPGEALQAYVSLYIKEEVQMEGLVRNIGNFARFLEAMSFSHGAMLNVSNVSRECEVERKTVQAYIEILYDLLLAFSVPVFSRRAKRAVVFHPKFYFFDAGVFRTLRPEGPLDRPEEIAGPSLEGLVAQHLRAWIDYGFSSCKLYYWRTKAGTEVDFIVYGKQGFWAVEVKNSDKVHRMDLRSLNAFKSDFPECKPILIYRGKDKLAIDGILCIPCEDFLTNLQPGQAF